MKEEGSADSRRFKCEHPSCGASYRRKEHLARHAVRHSRSRVFVCSVCGVSFDRSDTLRRHTKIHSKADDPSIPRASRACNRCHAQKSRCDGNFPCGVCLKKGVSCSFDRGRKNSESETAGKHRRQNVHYNQEQHLDQSDDDDGDDDTAAPNIRRVCFGNRSEAHESAAPSPLSDQSEYSVRRAFLQQEARIQDEAIRSVEQTSSIPLLQLEGLPMLTSTIDNDVTQRSDSGSSGSIDTDYYVRLYFDHFNPQWPFLFRQSFRSKHEPPVLVLATVMIGLWITGEARLQKLAWEIHSRLRAMLEAQMTKWDKSCHDAQTTNNNARWPLATYQAILLFTIFAMVAHRLGTCVTHGGDTDDDDDDIDVLLSVKPIFARLVRTCRTQGLLYYPSMLAQGRADDPIIYAWTLLEETKLFALTLFKVNVLFSRLVGDVNKNGNDDDNKLEVLSLSDLQFPLPDNGYLWSAHPIREWFRRRELQLRDPVIVPTKRRDGQVDHHQPPRDYNRDEDPWICDIFASSSSSSASKIERRRAWMRLGPWLGFLAGMDPG